MSCEEWDEFGFCNFSRLNLEDRWEDRWYFAKDTLKTGNNNKSSRLGIWQTFIGTKTSLDCTIHQEGTLHQEIGFSEWGKILETIFRRKYHFEERKKT